MWTDGQKIAVITDVYNGKRTLQRCLDSYAAQDYPYKELIVIDGSSSDGSVDIIRKNEHLISYWESKPDRGVYDAWNKALEYITGDWVHFLGADDFYYGPHVFTRVAKWLESCPQTFASLTGRWRLQKDQAKSWK